MINMQAKLLTMGTASQNSNGRWNASVWYLDEHGERKRKAFSGKTKKAVQDKLNEYVADFHEQVKAASDKCNQKLRDGMMEWLKIFKFESVQRVTYDRYEKSCERQIFPYLGDRRISSITGADIKQTLNECMNKGYSYSTTKKAYQLLKMFFEYLEMEDMIDKNPMRTVKLMKKDNYLSAQGKEVKAKCEEVTTFTPEEIELLKAEAFKRYGNGKRKHKQAAAYFLMLNTGLRRGEMCGLMNKDVDFENRVLHVRRSVKEYFRRNGMDIGIGQDIQVGPPKSKTSLRDIPLNDTAIEMIHLLQEEVYLGEESPLIPDEEGNFTKPMNLYRRFERLMKEAGIEKAKFKGLHALRHTFATTLINGIKQDDGSVKCLPTKAVADILGHTTTEITELYYVKRDNTNLAGMTNDFNL